MILQPVTTTLFKLGQKIVATVAVVLIGIVEMGTDPFGRQAVELLTKVTQELVHRAARDRLDTFTLPARRRPLHVVPRAARGDRVKPPFTVRNLPITLVVFANLIGDIVDATRAVVGHYSLRALAAVRFFVFATALERLLL